MLLLNRRIIFTTYWDRRRKKMCLSTWNWCLYGLEKLYKTLMNKFFELSFDDQRRVLQQASARCGLPPQAIEKDLWVSNILQIVFDLPFADKLIFKGGTSLSKVWHWPLLNNLTVWKPEKKMEKERKYYTNEEKLSLVRRIFFDLLFSMQRDSKRICKRDRLRLLIKWRINKKVFFLFLPSHPHFSPETPCLSWFQWWG